MLSDRGWFNVLDPVVRQKSNEANRRLRNARIEDYVFLKSFGLSQRQIAKRMGLSTRTLVRYERILGTTAPRPKETYMKR